MVSRRDFFKITGTAAGTAALTAVGAEASAPHPKLDPDRFGVLTDTTLCIGCRRCEWACAEQNGLPHGDLESYGDISVFDEMRRPDAESYTVVNRYSPPSGTNQPLDVKVQCLHCEHPACVSACIVAALEKSPMGPVVYDAWKCIGCRYCMIACPFQIPAYEYHDPLTPKVMKCTMCAERTLEQGLPPACVEMCPPEALVFGRRSELLDLAHRRIMENPSRYFPEVLGENIVGGTSWLMLTDRSPEEIDIPDLPDESPAVITETIQHGIFKGFTGPLMLFGILSILVKSSSDRRKEKEDELAYPMRQDGATPQYDAPDQKDQNLLAAESGHQDGNGHHKALPLAGRSAVPFWTPGVIVVAILAAAGLAALAARLIFGLGAVTNFNDQYPWGIWIGFDVASGVALAAGGFTVAFIAHVLNNEKYHVLVRPALLTAAIGYTFVGLGVCIDLGRYYNIWHVLMPWMWQGNSALFEVGMCVMIYLTVLYIEFLPIVCERFIGRVNLPGFLGRLNGFLDGLLRLLDRTLSRVMTFFIIAGVVLSCAHQSSLGTLMAIAPSKLQPLWATPVLPLLFLQSAFAVGLAMAIFESILASRSFKRPIEMHVLSPLARMIPLLLTIYFASKVIDLVTRDAWHILFEANLCALMFWIEIGVGVIIPTILFLSHRLRRKPVWLFSAAAMVVFGVVFNRFNVFVTCYRPPYSEGRYFPAWTEVMLTVGMVSLIVLLYRIWVFIFPILPVEEEVEHA